MEEGEEGRAKYDSGQKHVQCCMRSLAQSSATGGLLP